MIQVYVLFLFVKKYRKIVRWIEDSDTQCYFYKIINLLYFIGMFIDIQKYTKNYFYTIDLFTYQLISMIFKQMNWNP